MVILKHVFCIAHLCFTLMLPQDAWNLLRTIIMHIQGWFHILSIYESVSYVLIVD